NHAAGQDGQLTLDDLHRYVRTKVRRWALDARGAVQEPVLLPGPAGQAGSGPPGAPARLSPGEGKPATVERARAAEPPPPPARREDLERGWLKLRRLDELVPPHPATYSPQRWRAYRATLIRCQQLLQAGATDKASEMAAALDALEKPLKD